MAIANMNKIERIKITMYKAMNPLLGYINTQNPTKVTKNAYTELATVRAEVC